MLHEWRFAAAHRPVSLILVAFLAMAGVLALAAPVQAAKNNQIRIGGDYSYLKAPKGQGWRWCERTCNKDDRCRSWSFIKPSRQCRLKRNVAPAKPSSCCVSGVKKKSRKKSRREICGDFASKAMDDQDENLSRRCGYSGESWNFNYKVQFRACMGMSPRQRRQAAGLRKRGLDRCEENRDKINRKCQKFASGVDEIRRTASRNRCLLKRKDWLGSHKTAYDWCRDNRGKANADELEETRDQLSKCLAWGGGRYVERCDTYAKDAVKQYHDARRNECGFEGLRWSKKFKDHYQWCLKVEPLDTRNENRVRTRKLDRCLAQGGEGKQGKVACDHYARLAAEQTRSNRKQNCGLKGRRWLAGYDRHLAWCEQTSKTNRDEEMAYREGALAKCFERGGGKFDEACDRYATDSVAQNDKNMKRRCRLRGPLWHSSYIKHYKWCADAPIRRRDRRLRKRRRELSSCRFGGSDGGGRFELPFELPFGRRR